MRAKEVAGVLGGRRSRRGWIVRCPVPGHGKGRGDRNPSLSVSEDGGRLLVHCHAGCPQEAVIRALRSRRLWPEPPKSRGEIRATYDYLDLDGNVLFQVVRFHPKRFVQRRPCPSGLDLGCLECKPDPNGQHWHWDLTGIKPILYRLPEVAGAVERGDLVFVVEGEKDADRLSDLGLVATTNPGGAGKWRPEYSEVLRGARVVILPDNDRAGRNHSKAVAASLQGIAQSVRVVPLPGLPQRGDVWDWLGQGHTRDELLSLVEAAPEWEPEGVAIGEPILRSVAEVQASSVTWLWRSYIPLGKLSILDGDPGLGKSLLTIDLAARVSRGAEMPDGTRSDLEGPRSAVILSAEDDVADTIHPRLKAAGADLDLIFTLEGAVTLADVKEIEDAICETEAALLVVDPLMAFLRADAHRDDEVRSRLASLVRVAERTGCAVLVVRHLNKSAGCNPLYRGGGSIGIIGAARAGLLAAPHPNDEDLRVLAPSKANLTRLPPSLEYRIQTTTLEGLGDVPRIAWGDTSPLSAGDLLEWAADHGPGREAEDFLRGVLIEGPMPAREIYRAAREEGISQRTLRWVAERLGVHKGRQRTPEGSWVSLWVPPKGWSRDGGTTGNTLPVANSPSPESKTPGHTTSGNWQQTTGNWQQEQTSGHWQKDWGDALPLSLEDLEALARGEADWDAVAPDEPAAPCIVCGRGAHLRLMTRSGKPVPLHMKECSERLVRALEAT